MPGSPPKKTNPQASANKAAQSGGKESVSATPGHECLI